MYTLRVPNGLQMLGFKTLLLSAIRMRDMVAFLPAAEDVVEVSPGFHRELA